MLKHILMLLPAAAVLCACSTASAQYQPTQGMMMQQPMPSQMAQQMQPAPQQGQQAMQVASPYDAQGMLQAFQSQTSNEITALTERVRRVERAMIRLDRRMQIVERNEMARMAAVPEAQSGFQPTAYSNDQETPDFARMTSPFARSAMPYNQVVPSSTPNTGFTPVSMSTSAITSSLQPAPTPTANATALSPAPVMPSLADPVKKETKAAEDTEVAIWTVQYDQMKVWPERDQLANSRQIVEALRDADKPVALFARGARPSSKEFRERVRAISRYLGRVANVDNVPIAAMPAQHLDDNTIEILAAH